MSTYLDKCDTHIAQGVEMQKSNIYGNIRQNYIKFGICQTGVVNNFKDFISYLWSAYSENGYKYINGHLLMQSKYCDLYKLKKKYKIIKNPNDIAKIIENHGLFYKIKQLTNNWFQDKKFGSERQNLYNITDISSIPKEIYYKLLPFKETKGHRKIVHANQKVLEYYNLTLIEPTLRFYIDDYQIFDLNIPTKYIAFKVSWRI